MLIDLALSSPVVVAGGQAFGETGAYESLSGTAAFALDPAHPLNCPICDLGLAPVDDRGRVRFTADVWLLRPVDPARVSGTLLFDVVNRGNKTALRLNQATTPLVNRPVDAPDFGDGLLLRRGVTLATCGWQADVAEGMGRMRLHSPAAPVSGSVRVEIGVAAAGDRLPLAHPGHVAYPPADPEQHDATLTVRDGPFAARRTIPRDRWRFAAAAGDEPGGTHVVLRDGFVPGRIYEVIYRGEHPPLIGLGFAAVRDFASFLRFGGESPQGTTDGVPANPLARMGRAEIARAIAFGPSQSGRFLRHFLHEGFNEDESGRTVFDGVLADIAGGARGSFNHRFAQPSVFDRGHEGSGFPTELYPFSDAAEPDPLTGGNEGLGDRLQARGHAPKVMYSNTSAEYWGVGASLLHTDPTGSRDAVLPENVRVYHFAGAQHVPGPFPPGEAGFMAGAAEPLGRYPATPVNGRRPLRALFVALEAWIRDGTPPPASCHPTIAAGTLVPVEAAAALWPKIPGARFPDALRAVRLYDRGPDWKAGVIGREPPEPGPAYGTLVPGLDEDGNERAGVLLPEVAVPLATFAGWNYRHPARGAPDALASQVGSCFAFPTTEREAAASGDPRAPVERRYAGRADYAARVAAVTRTLVERGLLLAEDVPAIEQQADRWWDHAMRGVAAEPSPARL